MLFAIVLTLVVGASVGVGIILQWSLGMDRDLALLTAVISIACSIQFLIKLADVTRHSIVAKLLEEDLVDSFEDSVDVSQKPASTRKRRSQRALAENLA